jgi:hypothetical protein
MGTDEIQRSEPNSQWALFMYHFGMAKDEKDFARLPGAHLINRYMPGTSLEAREKALENLRSLLTTLLNIEEQKSSNPLRSQSD